MGDKRGLESTIIFILSAEKKKMRVPISLNTAEKTE